MALRLTRLSRSQRDAPTRIGVRNVREIAGTAVLYPDWPQAAPRSSDMAVVLHLPSTDLLVDYLALVGPQHDVFVVVPDDVAIPESTPTPGVGTVELLAADPVASGLYQLTALINSGRLSGYRTVVRHVHSHPEDREQLVALLRHGSVLELDSAIHSDLDLAGLFVQGVDGGPAFTRDVSYRASQLLKRVSSRFSHREFRAGARSVSTIAIRGAVLESLRALRVDHQDFYATYFTTINQGQAAEYIKPPVLDKYAEPAVTCALLALVDASGLRLADVERIHPLEADVTLPAAGTRRAGAWAIYHPDLSSVSKTRNASWPHLSSSMPMYLGQQLPIAPSSFGFSDPLATADRAKQVELAREVGIEGFLVPTPWSENGLEPREFFDSVTPDENFPWALVLQHSVARRINPAGNLPLLSPWTDPGEDAYAVLAEQVSTWTATPSYLRRNGRPVVIVQDIAMLDNPEAFLAAIREAVERTNRVRPWIGIVETHLTTGRPGEGTIPDGADGVVQIPPANLSMRNRIKIGGRFAGFTGEIVNLGAAASGTAVSVEARTNDEIIPGAFVGYDTTPELRSQGTVAYNWNAMTFRLMLDNAVRSVATRDDDKRIVIINSWNGWADMSQLEPGHFRGESYLSVVKDTLFF